MRDTQHPQEKSAKSEISNFGLFATGTNYNATLPNGVTVELLGICEHPSEGKQWWAPNGSPLDWRPFESSPWTLASPGIKHEYLFRVSGGDGVLVKVHNAAPFNGGMGPRRLSESSAKIHLPESETLYWYVSQSSRPLEQADITLLIGRADNWATRAALPLPAENVMNTTGNVMISPPVEKGGKTLLDITAPADGRECRVVAVDTNGNEHPGTAMQSTGRLDNTAVITIRAEWALSMKDMRSIEYQTQEFVPVTFKNVTLRPGVTTNVQVEAGQAADDSQPTAASASEPIKQFSTSGSQSSKEMGELEFRIVPDMTTEQAKEVSWPNANHEGVEWLPIKKEENNQQQWPWYTVLPYKKVDDTVYLLVSNKSNNTMLADNSWGLQKVYTTKDTRGRAAVGFSFDEKGAELFYDLTSNHIGKRLAIVINDIVYNAPQINSAVRGSGIITGQFEETEVEKLVEILSIGMPPVNPLAKGQQPGFSPVVDITIYDAVSVKKDSLIDFDTGTLFSLPDNWLERTPEEAMQWMVETGLDAGGASRDTVKGLMCEDMIFASMNNSYWDNVKPDFLAANDLWEVGKPGRPAYMSGKGQLPAMYIFKTREGGIGILQITGFNENPKGINIRYKMLQDYDENSLRPGGEREGK